MVYFDIDYLRMIIIQLLIIVQINPISIVLKTEPHLPPPMRMLRNKLIEHWCDMTDVLPSVCYISIFIYTE